jgi:molecular chaperone DnaK (HSP70)
VPQIEVAFDVDANGILSVSANDKASGAKQEITITSEKGRLSEEEIERMVAEAEEFADEDKAAKAAVEARNAFESYAYSLKSSLETLKTLADDDKAALAAAVKDAEAWLDENPTGAAKDDVDARKKTLEEVANPILQRAYAAAAADGAPADGAPAADDAEEDDDLEVPDM